MRDFVRILEKGVEAEAVDRVLLTFEERRRSRQRVLLESGVEACLLLPRGISLGDGELLQATDDAVIEVKAADEELTAARTRDPLLLSRAAYHLGNRHVLLEILPGELRYPCDAVLDKLMLWMGLEIEAIRAPFFPDPGAYYAHGGQ
jgi:urease accessory protein